MPDNDNNNLYMIMVVSLIWMFIKFIFSQMQK